MRRVLASVTRRIVELVVAANESIMKRASKISLRWYQGRWPWRGARGANGLTHDPRPSEENPQYSGSDDLDFGYWCDAEGRHAL